MVKRKSLKQVSELKKGYKVVPVSLDLVDYLYLSKQAEQAAMPLSRYLKRVIAIYLNAERDRSKQK